MIHLSLFFNLAWFGSPMHSGHEMLYKSLAQLPGFLTSSLSGRGRKKEMAKSLRCKWWKQRLAGGPAQHGQVHASTPATVRTNASKWRSLQSLELAAHKALQKFAFAASAANQIAVCIFPGLLLLLLLSPPLQPRPPCLVA
ncbi:hypothetical protein RJ639_024157 [Escallonia herrerae]|uniref:Uncharacterized protein n=1 Tax=Escallonia herrerae TaxID=1293975 RepID=A0AA88V2U8_9ASTE|nr:hypothetical protein RJ639_024157 [Escallonia herrerae]